MSEIVGPLRRVRNSLGDGVNTPGSVQLADDVFTAMWLDPDGTLADRFDRDPELARIVFLDKKREDSTRKQVKRRQRGGR